MKKIDIDDSCILEHVRMMCSERPYLFSEIIKAATEGVEIFSENQKNYAHDLSPIIIINLQNK